MEQFLVIDNIIAAQTPKVIDAFNKILNQFDCIVEIGFHRGGFSIWLDQNKNNDAKLVCYDIDFSNKQTDNNIDFRLANCFDINIIKEITNYINNSNKTLILCDGGDKESEFKIYSKLLKSGDVIMLHDYCDTPEEYSNFAKQVHWPSPAESFYQNIYNSIHDNNLKKYHYDLFKSVFWGSFIKN